MRLVVSATQQGALLGIPASGKPVDAVDIYRIDDRRQISKEWAFRRNGVLRKPGATFGHREHSGERAAAASASRSDTPQRVPPATLKRSAE
jgi:hypothetical protein